MHIRIDIVSRASLWMHFVRHGPSSFPGFRPSEMHCAARTFHVLTTSYKSRESPWLLCDAFPTRRCSRMHAEARMTHVQSAKNEGCDCTMMHVGGSRFVTRAAQNIVWHLAETPRQPKFVFVSRVNDNKLINRKNPAWSIIEPGRVPDSRESIFLYMRK